MGVEGQTMAAREPKHQSMMLEIFHIRSMIDRVEVLLLEIKGIQGKIEKDPNPQPDGPEMMSLSQFLMEAPSRLHEQTERLDKILAELREELI